MKKIYQIIMFCAMGIALVSCGGNSNTSSNESSDTDYREAIKAGDFETAHKILEKLHDEGISSFKFNEFVVYLDALDYVYKKEIQTILLNDGPLAEDKIVFLLSEIPVDGDAPSGGIRECYSGTPTQIEKYFKSVASFNRLCDFALTLSLNRSNATFAQNVIDLYKEDLKIFLHGATVNGVAVGEYQEYDLYTNDSRNAAIKKYNNAVNSGRFGDGVYEYKIVEEYNVITESKH